MRLVIVEGKVAVLRLNSGRAIVTNGTLLRSCARVTRSFQITLSRICSMFVHFMFKSLYVYMYTFLVFFLLFFIILIF